MTDLPSGTVTFLFTDIEGSTRLLRELGDEAYGEALGDHRRKLRAAFARNRGVEVDTQGDAFFVAFATAQDALAAAAEAHEALGDGRVQVRIGVHTGTPLLIDGGYVGADLHRAARIAAAAHGGQTVASAATAELARGSELFDLGLHRFKDLAAEERVFQLGSGDFPPLRSLYRTNLPVPATPFLGRHSEVREVVELVTRSDVRLVTLTGPGGTGKTRLSLQAVAEAADEFPDGVWWVPLAALRDPAVVPATTARALGIAEQAGRDIGDVLAEAIAGKRLVLVFDNAEHLLPGVAHSVARPLETDGPTVVVTSRERLRLQAEHTFAVPSLTTGDARELFVARARQVDASFEATSTVDEICGRLDDLPLALELAAARTALFSPEQLLERLSGRLDLLKGGRDTDARQQTLRATIAWSFDLLEPAEQELFASLAVFVGGCTLEAAEEVCRADVDVLQSLLDKSLVRRRVTPFGPRYWMLETIRDFAVEQLETLPSRGELRRRHAEAFAELAEKADVQLRRGPDQQEWGDRIAEDHDNVRAGLRFGLDVDPAIAARIIGKPGVLLLAARRVRGSPPMGGRSPRTIRGTLRQRPRARTRVRLLSSPSGWATWRRPRVMRTTRMRRSSAPVTSMGMADALRERGKSASSSQESAAARRVPRALGAGRADRRPLERRGRAQQSRRPGSPSRRLADRGRALHAQ